MVNFHVKNKFQNGTGLTKLYWVNDNGFNYTTYKDNAFANFKIISMNKTLK